MRLTDRPQVSDLATDRPVLPDDRGREPTLKVPPALTGAAEPVRLDPTRVELGPAPRPAKRRSMGGPIGSVLLHLVPLLLLVTWAPPSAEIARPIPIKLVLEQPPPPPPSPQPAAPKPPSKPPKGSFASDDFAAQVSPKVQPGRSEASPEPREARPQAAEAEAKLVAPPLPPPPPVSLPELLASDPLATPVEPRPEAVAHLDLPPKPDPPKEPAKTRTPRPRESEWPLPLRPEPAKTVRTALLLGPNAVRDEYCAQALSLTMRQIGLLPRSLTDGRQGATVLAIHVLGDGTIDGVKVARSSGYPDIDGKIEQMVVAVGRYPPLPPWMGPSMEFTFQMHFPNKWQR